MQRCHGAPRTCASAAFSPGWASLMASSTPTSPRATSDLRNSRQIRGVTRRWIGASLAGDAGAMCALVDPATLSDLEQIHMPCEELQSGTLDGMGRRRHRPIPSSRGCFPGS